MSSLKDEILIRQMKAEDSNFVVNSWLRSLRSSSPYFHSIPEKIFYTAHKNGIIATIERPEAKCLIVTPKDSPDIIVGYLVYEDRNTPHYCLLHYCYVKHKFRGLGLANYLIGLVSNGRSLVSSHYSSKIKNLSFNPYMFKMERL